MSLPNNPSRDDIWAELVDSNYRNGGTDNNSLKDMDAYVFGGDGSGYSRDGFGGYGRPSAANYPETNVGDFEADMRVDIQSTGGFEVTYYFEYWEGNQSKDQASTVYTSPSGTTNSTGIQSITVTGLDPSTTYTYEARFYNKFSNANHQVATGEDEVFTTNAYSPAAPSITQFNCMSRLSWHLEWSDTDGDMIEDYDVNYRRQGESTWQTGGSWSNKVNWGTNSNPKEGDWAPSVNYNIGDTIEIRIRAYDSDYNAFSNWSSIATDTI